MYGPRPIRFPAHWCADYSKYRGFLAGGISTASSLLPFFGTRLRRQNFNLSPTQYRHLRRLPKGSFFSVFFFLLLVGFPIAKFLFPIEEWSKKLNLGQF